MLQPSNVGDAHSVYEFILSLGSVRQGFRRPFHRRMKESRPVTLDVRKVLTRQKNNPDSSLGYNAHTSESQINCNH